MYTVKGNRFHIYDTVHRCGDNTCIILKACTTQKSNDYKYQIEIRRPDKYNDEEFNFRIVFNTKDMYRGSIYEHTYRLINISGSTTTFFKEVMKLFKDDTIDLKIITDYINAIEIPPIVVDRRMWKFKSFSISLFYKIHPALSPHITTVKIKGRTGQEYELYINPTWSSKGYYTDGFYISFCSNSKKDTVSFNDDSKFYDLIHRIYYQLDDVTFYQMFNFVDTLLHDKINIT